MLPLLSIAEKLQNFSISPGSKHLKPVFAFAIAAVYSRQGVPGVLFCDGARRQVIVHTDGQVLASPKVLCCLEGFRFPLYLEAPQNFALLLCIESIGRALAFLSRECGHVKAKFGHNRL